MVQALAEKLEHTGPAEKERVASAPQNERLARAVFAKNERNKAISLVRQIVRWERVKVIESRTHFLRKRRGFKADAWRGKS